MSDYYGQKERNSRSRSPLSRLRRLLRRQKKLAAVLLLFAAVVIGGVVWLALNFQDAGEDLIAQNAVNVGTGYRNITYQGKNYRYNNRVTTILYAGLDSDTPLVQYRRYAMAPRADSISLVVLDELHRKMTVIALNRETITKIRRYTLSGISSGLYSDFLCYAYTYGDGGKASCDGLCEAVSLLLYGVPIDDYVITNRGSLSIVADMLGPVEVTVPNNDMAEIDARLFQGAQVTIDAQNLESFVRYRDTEKDFSNVGRMQRQQSYITGAINRVQSILNEQPDELWNQLQKADRYVQTNITKNRYLDLTRIVKNTAFSSQNYYIPEGRNVSGEDHDEFYPDEDALLAKVIELFYIKQ
ncbi:MAG: LCP family protein [Clostridia bacterium]|nr:LCP family protein [Clostridia bacterium]MBR0407613.1 LCP family protein [Clostridia bacterium]